MSECIQCGECCCHGGVCTLRRWGDLPDKFSGVCELLDRQSDRQTICLAIKDMLRDDPEYPWTNTVKKHLLKTFIGVACTGK